MMQNKLLFGTTRTFGKLYWGISRLQYGEKGKHPWFTSGTGWLNDGLTFTASIYEKHKMFSISN